LIRDIVLYQIIKDILKLLYPADVTKGIGFDVENALAQCHDTINSSIRFATAGAFTTMPIMLFIACFTTTIALATVPFMTK